MRTRYPPPSKKRIRASCPFIFCRHPASVRRSCATASCLRDLPPLDARSPLGRSGAVSVPRASSLRLPDARSLRPGYTRLRYLSATATSSVILTPGSLERSLAVPRFVSRSAGRHPCHRAGSLAGHPGPPAFGECALSCALPASSRRLRRPSWPSLRSSVFRWGVTGVPTVSRRASLADSPGVNRGFDGDDLFAGQSDTSRTLASDRFERLHAYLTCSVRPQASNACRSIRSFTK